MRAKIDPSQELLNSFLVVMLKDRGGSFTIRADDPLLNIPPVGTFEVVVQGNIVTLKSVPNYNMVVN